MPSIRDRDDPRPIVVEADLTPAWVIIVISIILFILFWIWMIYIYRSTSTTSGTILLQCGPGQCATDIATGVKDCPLNPDDVKIINPEVQVCNSPFTCENARTPYALRSDGSTDPNGVCETDVQCRCLTEPQCAYYVTAFFSAENGNPFQSIAPQRIVFEQNAAGNNAENQFVAQPPYSLESSTTQFCQIPNEWVSRVWPPIAGTNDQQVFGPCIVGTMAYVPDDPNTFNAASRASTPVACVQGEPTPCSGFQTPMWNKKTYQINCLNF